MLSDLFHRNDCGSLYNDHVPFPKATISNLRTLTHCQPVRNQSKKVVAGEALLHLTIINTNKLILFVANIPFTPIHVHLHGRDLLILHHLYWLCFYALGKARLRRLRPETSRYLRKLVCYQRKYITYVGKKMFLAKNVMNGCNSNQRGPLGAQELGTKNQCKIQNILGADWDILIMKPPLCFPQSFLEDTVVRLRMVNTWRRFSVPRHHLSERPRETKLRLQVFYILSFALVSSGKPWPHDASERFKILQSALFSCHLQQISHSFSL